MTTTRRGRAWNLVMMALTLLAMLTPSGNASDLETPLQLEPEVFRAWGEEHDYASATSNDGRVLLIADSRRLKKHMKHVEKVLKALDASVLGGGPVAREAEGSSMILIGLRDAAEFKDLSTLVLAADDGKDGRDGEDGQAGEPGQDGEAGGDAGESDVHDQPFFRALDFDIHLTTLGMQLDAVQLAGFWDDSFEWLGQAKDPAMKPSNHPESELANRLAHLWVYRQYGPQPAWLRRGLAWTFEYETTKVDGDKRIGRFPQLLFTALPFPEQPRTWNSRLEGPLSTLDLETFGWLTEWSAAYQSNKAAQAWGLTQYLLNDKKHSRVLPAAMRDLAAAGAAHWEESEDGYEATTDIQLAILQEHFGEDVLERASKAFKSAEKKFR